MELRQRQHGTHQLRWKDTSQRWNDALELLVSLGKVGRTIQFLQEEPGCSTVSGAGEQICVGERKAPVLESFQRKDFVRQICIGGPASPLNGNALKIFKNPKALRSHSRRVAGARRKSHG
jgi:hypothetical protein